MKAAYLCLHVRAQRNRTQFQRAADLTENYTLFVLSRGPVCQTVTDQAELVRTCPDSLLYQFLYPLWLVWQVLVLRRSHDITFVYSDHARQTLLAGAILQRLGLVWMAHIWDDPNLGSDLEGRPESLYRVAVRIYNRSLLWFVGKTLGDADLIVVSMVPDILAGLHVSPTADNVLAVTNGVDVDATQRLAGDTKPEPGFTIVYVGPVQRNRDVETILDATERVADSIDDLTLEFVGEVSDDAGDLVAAFRSREAVADVTVELHGFVDHERALEAVDRADVCLCTLSSSIRNYEYSYPIKLFEYMALGKATIATRMGGTSSVIRDGETGLLVPPEDPRALATAIRRLYDEPELRAEIGANAREDAAAYDWQSINETIDARMQSVLDDAD